MEEHAMGEGDEGQMVDRPKHERKRKPKSTPTNPLQAGLLNFITSHSDLVTDIPPISALPKRFTLYSPLLLLPANFTTHSPAWTAIYESLHDPATKQALYKHIAQAFKTVTHIAILAPIAPTTVSSGESNIVRHPSDLQPVYGDFGPSSTLTSLPTDSDFTAAFWASTQVTGGDITQVWAPRWTMFSRGNASEKARILDAAFVGLDNPAATEVVDFYVGIGYFALCYLKRGVRRVWGWDLNPWSIEGLRRGCEANGWRCLVVDLHDWDAGRTTLEELVLEIVQGGKEGKPVRCVAFLGDNRSASGILKRVEGMGLQMGCELATRVRHTNLGLLPTSKGSWNGAVRSLDAEHGGWLHVHENVDVQRIDEKKDEVLAEIRLLVETNRGPKWTVDCIHIEQVKTYAPGVMHCVFDVAVLPHL